MCTPLRHDAPLPQVPPAGLLFRTTAGVDVPTLLEVAGLEVGALPARFYLN